MNYWHGVEEEDEDGGHGELDEEEGQGVGEEDEDDGLQGEGGQTGDEDDDGQHMLLPLLLKHLFFFQRNENQSATVTASPIIKIKSAMRNHRTALDSEPTSKPRSKPLSGVHRD